ncbi:MAG: L,D-transpeptidase [Patescibacteria group bacterium]
MNKKIIIEETVSVLLLCIVIVAVLTLPIAQAHDNHFINIKIQNANNVIGGFTFPLKNYLSGVSIAVADLGTDGNEEILIGDGIGNAPYIHVLRQDGSEIGKFLAYAPNMGVGINVEACDLDGDGINEIIASPQKGGGPHIRIFNNIGKAIDAGGFFAYQENFTSGVNLACGNIDDDPQDELITLPATGGGPHVKIWKMNHGEMKLHNEFFAQEKNNLQGLVGLIVDKKIFLATQHGEIAKINTYVIHNLATPKKQEEVSINAYGIVNLFLQNDRIKIATTNGTIIDLESKQTTNHDGEKFSTVQAIHTKTNSQNNLIIAPFRPMFQNDKSEKTIIIDLSKQQLFAYESGVLAHTFPISSARKPWITPARNTRILAKIYEVHYAWFYASGSQENYDLGWVPYNLRIFPHIYIHYAPWHNNFGHPMSHGCVNVALDNMKWIYNWAVEGIPVEVRN